MSVLDTEEWAQDARSLIDMSYKLDVSLPAMLFIRHSHREDPADMNKIREQPLTDLGREAAKEFGAELNPDRNYFLFSSPLNCCCDTAENIIKGIQSTGNETSPNRIIYTLLKVKHRQQIIDAFITRDKRNYVPYWIAGFYPRQQVESAINYSR